jgi:hypothetical protein
MKLHAALTSLCPFFMSLVSAPPTIAQGLPHLEQCTLTEKWDYQGGELGVKNVCDKSVAIQFMTEREQRVKSIELIIA